MRRPPPSVARTVRTSTLATLAAVLTAVLTTALVAAPAATAASRAGALARAAEPQAPPPEAHVVVDAATGEVLFGDKIHEARPPASTAKIMTALTAVERLAPDATIKVSELAASQPASRINMVAGHEWRFTDALASLVMASANDAAYAIAETAGGSLAGFADAMQATATRLGMRDSTFADPAGFDDEASFGGGPRMSPFDIAIATRNALAVPQIATFAAMRSYEFTDPAGGQRSLTNHNKMLPGGTRAYEGTTGFKTGFTRRAGHTLVITATRGSRTLIAVVLDTYDTYGWAAHLLDRGFAIAPGQGTGEHLPDIAVSTYSRRAEDRAGFLALARGSEDALAAPTPGNVATTPTTVAAAGTPTSAPGSPLAAEPIASESEPAGSDSGSSLLSARNLGVAMLALLATLVALRRRAVKRQRARRLAARRRRSALMRSGGLPVVDGRYRPGTRIGPPVESHVRVHPSRGEP